MKPSTKRLLSFTAAFLMVIGALFVFFSLIQPAYRESQEVKGQILAKEITLQNEQNAASQVQKLVEQYRGDQSPQIAVSSALPPVNDQAQIIHQLQSLAATNKLGVQSIAVSQPGAKPLGRQAASATAPTASLVKPVGVVTAQIRVTGSYSNFKTFLSSIETNIRVTDVSSLVIIPVGQPNQDFYNFDLTLSTYYQSS
jgi:Tfp pilus assembly protein PilO